MRDILFPFQESALAELHERIEKAHNNWSERDPQIISFSAPTGSGKTIIMTALFEEILHGCADYPAEPDSVFVWLSDSPELNEQSRLKIESKSEKIPVRDLVTIDSNFDTEYFEGGSVCFLNTQKLGTDKLLTLKSDVRQYTIWETLANTARKIPKRFYVVIDEAHRGANLSARAENAAQTIMQKFIKGSPEDGMCVMPLVIGVTATPQRFDRLTAAVSSTTQKIIVPSKDVRDSGLLKDRIVIHYPELAINANMTMFKSAAENWKRKCERWTAYCEYENEKPVKPVFVVQVEDGSGQESTHTDIGACLDMLEEVLGRKLREGEVVQTFHDREAIIARDLKIYKIEASRIEENEAAQIVFFKMNLSTGWDCPRAETMMSFRKARDFTYIAQLLGRMIRTPLARRINSDAELNDVSLFLPDFDESTVKTVIDALQENEAIIPAETGTNRELVTLSRNPAYKAVFAAMDNLVTYRIDSSRKQAPLRLLIKLSRALTMDAVDLTAQKAVKESILGKIEEGLEKIKKSGEFEHKAKAITGFTLGTVTFEYGENIYTFDESAQQMTVTNFDIDRHYEQAGKKLGEGLHIDYWSKHTARKAADVKIEIIVFTGDLNSMAKLNAFAETLFYELYEKNKLAIAKLNESRKSFYEKITNASAQPVSIPWELPETIDFTVTPESHVFPKHLYCDAEGVFKTTLNAWESEVIQEEIENGAVTWLRNLDRKNWSLEIPYEESGVTTPMFPDLLVVQLEGGEYVFDILEPHDPSRKDNYPKAVGLAKFAEKHWDKFRKIQLIRKQTGADGENHFFRLDMADTKIRNKVRGIKSNEELDGIFAPDAEIGGIKIKPTKGL